jgi:hypothetical protein
MPAWKALSYLLVGTLIACWTGVPVAAQSNSSLSIVTSAAATPIDGASGYNQPPKNILDVMHAPSPPVPVMSPTLDMILLVSLQDSAA